MTEGSQSFVADALFEDWSYGHHLLPENDDFRSSITKTFGLPEDDNYVYHAIASVSLAQVQHAIDVYKNTTKHGAESGLHAWYFDNEGEPVKSPHMMHHFLGT